MKTAISMPDDLFQALCEASEEDNLSRSRIFREAVHEYLERRKNLKLLAALNEAYSQEDSKEEKQIRIEARKYYARKISKEKW